MGLVNWKGVHAPGRGNKAVTRTQNAIQAISLRITRASDRYRAARSALLVLEPEGEWKARLQELKAGDLRNPAGDDPDDLEDNSREGRRKRVLGEGHKETSWIWLTIEHTAQDAVQPSEVSNEEVVEGKSKSIRTLSTNLTD